MINKLLADVPARIWEEGRVPNQHVWETEFNVAAWIRAKGKGEICLLLCHEDETGQYDCVVERCTINGESNNLMSGLVNVCFTGKVRKVQVLLKLSEEEKIRFHVDELFVQRNGREMRRENKLISHS